MPQTKKVTDMIRFKTETRCSGRKMGFKDPGLDSIFGTFRELPVVFSRIKRLGLFGFFFATIGSLVCSAAPGTTFGVFSVAKDGSFELGGASCRLLFFAPAYRQMIAQGESTVKPLPSFPAVTGKTCNWRGEFLVAGGKFHLDEEIETLAPGEYNLIIKLSSAVEIPSEIIALQMALPTSRFAGRHVTVNGKLVELPETFKTAELNTPVTGTTVTLQCNDFKLEIAGNATFKLQDERQYGQNHFSLRFYLNAGSSIATGNVKNAELKLKLKISGYDSRKIDLRRNCNMAFGDEVAGDGKGGWTDQGADNDLSSLIPGLKLYGGLEFDVIDPAANNGKSCIVLGSKRLFSAPDVVSVEVNAGPAKNLYLLHAAAWTGDGRRTVGRVRIRYQDGTSQVFPVVSNVNIANWWQPAAPPQADVVWTGACKSSYVGLYRTAFPLENKGIAGIELINSSDMLWMIVGATLSGDTLPAIESAPYYIVASPEWRPFEFPRDVAAGSVLDFSCLGLLDPPAGKYGRVIVNNGRFVFEGRRDQFLRFYGTNLYFDMCFPPKARAEKLASVLASMGYNSVRFHHFDELLFKNGEPDREKLDRLDYLLHCFKNKGIYVTIDLYTMRSLHYQGRLAAPDEAKALMLFDDVALEDVLKCAEKLLTHVNPYTGLAWKDDPALATISLLNEDSIDFNLRPGNRFKEVFDRHFESRPVSGEQMSSDSSEQNRRRRAFIVETHTGAYGRMRDFLRKIGVANPLSDENVGMNPSMAFSRKNYDYVDNHSYWDHPSFTGGGWGLPARFSQQAAVKSVGMELPIGLFAPRLFGKPYTISEFNYCSPNRYRAEGGALLAAYAALQDWDGLYRYGFGDAHWVLERECTNTFFDGYKDPMQLLSDRLGILLFLRRDVKPSALKIPVLVNFDSIVTNQYSPALSSLGLIGQLGTVFRQTTGEKTFPAETGQPLEALVRQLNTATRLESGGYDPATGTFTSSTGELSLNRKIGRLIIDTPRSSVVIATDRGRFRCGPIQIDNSGDFACVSASSLDEKPVSESKRLLVMHLTNSLNTMIRFRDSSMTILEDYGKLPLLARRGVADITLKLEPGAVPIVYGVDLGGKRLGVVKSEFGEGNLLKFRLDTFTFDTPCFVYEIIRNAAN